jgi:hypothetical protein
MKRTTARQIRECMELPHWRNPKRRVALLVAAALHDAVTQHDQMGARTRRMCRTVRDRIIERLNDGHRMNFIAIK